MLHKTKDGQKIPIEEMTDQHLINTIKLIERQADEGIEVVYGDSGFEGADAFADVEILEGEEVLEHWGYWYYKSEANKRNLKV